TGLQNFMDSCFSKTTSTIMALDLLTRFDKLKIPSLKIDGKYAVILRQYGEEVEEIRKLYMKYKEEPPIPRNMPPVAGKVTWVRQLSHRIEYPMLIFM
ncbi:dynein axonemal heavy chain 5-like, partial [Mytilus edulis]